jgi:hypothetical protein
MLMRPGFRVGRPSILGTVARTAVVAGTATAVAGGVSRRQQGKAQQKAQAEAQQQQQAATAAAPPPPAPAAAADDTITQLERLGTLKQQGILTDAEFQAQKTKLLGL